MIALRRSFWVALLLGALWMPVLIVNTVIDPPADWVTKMVRAK